MNRASAILIGLVWVGLLILNFPVVDESLSPDSVSYLEGSLFRQPLYGYWINSVSAVTDSWSSVKIIQVVLFGTAGFWCLLELGIPAVTGAFSSVILLILYALLMQLGLLEIVATITTEGLFYTLILTALALLIRSVRTRSSVSLALLCIVVILITQLRSAALVTAVLPIATSLLCMVSAAHNARRRRSGIVILTATIASAVLLPWLLSKQPAQLTTEQDRFGFVVLPRVSLLETPAAVNSLVPEWESMARTWRHAAKPLSAVAVGQFDAQLQESIRYHLAPDLLLPELFDKSELHGWNTSSDYSSATTVSMEWIEISWQKHVRLSALHLWGLLTMGHLMDNTDRAGVWNALNQVATSTWRAGGPRTDYPLNRIHEPLKPRTELVYMFIRFVSILSLVIGIVSILRTLTRLLRNQPLQRHDLVLGVAFCWAVAHSTPAALTVFAEYRYNYANALALWGGLAAWFGYMGYKPRDGLS